MTAQNNKGIPCHVAIIMDGNGRWAKVRGVEKVDGHRAGVDALRRCVVAAKDAGVQYLTAYAFSTENWGRPREEVDAIMEIFSLVVLNQARELAQNKIKLRFIGAVEELEAKLQSQIKEVESMEVEDAVMTLAVAINYSSRWDILRATCNISKKGKEINEENFREELSTKFLPDVDLVIRTSGERRLSNFMLWESSYAELYFCDTLWPDFSEEEFNKAIKWYSDRDRRFGVRQEK